MRRELLVLAGCVALALGSLVGLWMLRHPHTRLSRWVDRGAEQ